MDHSLTREQGLVYKEKKLTRLGWKIAICNLKVPVQVGENFVHKHIENRCSIIRMERRFQGACGAKPGSLGTKHITA